MIDAQKLLDQFLGTQGGRGPGGYPQQPRGGSGGLGGDLGRIAQAALSGRSGGGTSGLGGLVGQVLGGAGGRSGSGLGGGLAGKAIGGALAGGLASQLLKGKATKGLGGSALKLGGLTLVAGLGYKAWTNYQAQQEAARAGSGGAAALPRPVGPETIPSAASTPFHPPVEEAETRARLILSAMIAAAKADGYIDRDEEAAIFGRVDDLALDAAEKGALMDELRRPLTVDEIVARTPGPEAAVEVYTASVIVVDPDHPAERAYLDYLAARLELAPELVAEIRRTTDEARGG